MNQRRSRSIPWGVVVAAIGVVVAIGAVVVIRLRSGEAASASASAEAAPAPSGLEALLAAASSAAGPLDPSQPKGQIFSKGSLAEAIDVARPLMANTVGRLDVGSALLSLWASRSLTWDTLQSLPETSPALFRKDPEAERGKRFCVSGVITVIRAEKTLASRLVEDRALPLIERAAATSPAMAAAPVELPAAASADPEHGLLPAASADPLLAPSVDWTIPNGGKVYFATVASKPDEPGGTAQPARPSSRAVKDLLVVEVIAVRSSGALVDGSEARVCGILTGVTQPGPGSGPGLASDVTEHRLVGMFDLPENRAAPPNAVAHQGG